MSLLKFTAFSYSFPDGSNLFRDQHYTFSGGKLGIVGDNGAGKSTLLKLIHGVISPAHGMNIEGKTVWLNQRHHPDHHKNILQSLHLYKKWEAMKRMLDGRGVPEDLEIIGEDWELEQRMLRSLESFGLNENDLHRPLGTLSHGQRVKLWLATGIQEAPDILLLDEPTNHLDQEGRTVLYDWIKNTSVDIIVVSHDRELLQFMDQILEIRKGQWNVFKGNYAEYEEQRSANDLRMHAAMANRLKQLEETKRHAQKTIERHKKRQSRGAKRNVNSGMGAMQLNSLKNGAEHSLGKTSKNQEQALKRVREEMEELKEKMPRGNDWKIDVHSESGHGNKCIVQASGINIIISGQALWQKGLNLDWRGSDRIHLCGANGTGKSMLLKTIAGISAPSGGLLKNRAVATCYIDQDFKLVDRDKTVYANFSSHFNTPPDEGERRIRLARYAFRGERVFSLAATLSGGEMMRLSMACIFGTDRMPDLLMLDEPDNNLDMASMELLAGSLRQYHGCLVVVSHDTAFIRSVGTNKQMDLSEYQSEGSCSS